MARNTLTYSQFIRSSKLGESVDSHAKRSKFKVGQTVRAGKNIGKIYSYSNGEYLVIIGSDHRVFLEKELRPLKSRVVENEDWIPLNFKK